MLKRFLSYYKPHIGLFIIDMLSGVIVAACNLVYPVIVKRIVNEFVANQKQKEIIVAASMLLGIFLLKALFNYIIGFWGHIVGVRMQADMRRDLFNKYESLPISFYDENKTGDLITRIASDLFDVSELAHHGPENLFLAILMFVGSFIMLWKSSKELTLILIAVLPFVLLFTFLSRKGMRDALKNARKELAALDVSVENSIGGIRESKSYVTETHELEKFKKANFAFMGYRTKAVKYIGIFDSIMELMSDLLYLIVIVVGALFLINGKIADSGDYLAFVLYVTMFLTPIKKICNLYEQMQEGMSGFERFCEVMEQPSEVETGTVEIDDIKGDIAFSHVSFHYDSQDPNHSNRMVLSDLSFSVKAGETLALVGPSGGGKTTICNLIPRFYPIETGSITVDGRDIRDITLPSLRKNIGIVSQNVFLFDGTVRENIAYGKPDATDEEILEAAKRANILDYINSMPDGFDTKVGERGVKLSGGQKQRVAIARVFLKNPSLLILDEATSALDNVTEMQIQQSLEELSRGRTVLVVAHRLSTVKNADKIAVIDRTGIVEMGTHDELLAKDGEYRKLYTYQFKDAPQFLA